VQDVKHVEALGLADDAIEDLSAAMNPLLHALIFVARHKRESERHVREAAPRMWYDRSELRNGRPQMSNYCEATGKLGEVG
jgi:hypothetical protein